MTTFTPRAPYSQHELSNLYPAGLQLEQVQVLLRHGERSPVNARFQNAGLAAHWPYCNAARRMRSVVLSIGGEWDVMSFRRQLETFDKGVDDPVFATGPRGETDGICLPGELSDRGRETTLALGQRLRRLYADQIGFMPQTLQNTEDLYLRATPIPRALESVQQVFHGMYPPSSRSPDFEIPPIVTRSARDETLFPNEGACRRFGQLAAAFGERTSTRWNDSDEMAYLTKLIGKWMPEDSQHRVKVDGHPRLSGIMDTVNSTLAHGPETRLPSEFYDKKGIEHVDKICVEEWFSGYDESTEYRSLGIGSLVGDIVARMVERTRKTEATKATNRPGYGQNVRFALSGCHDTTLAAVLTSLGAFQGEKWPPYTSHIAVELFRQQHSLTSSGPRLRSRCWWSAIFGPAKNVLLPSSSSGSRTPLTDLSSTARSELEGYYVRLRYNDRIMTVPACKEVGKHYGDDESLCTLAAFKEVADKFTPKDWKKGCASNLDRPAVPTVTEKAGY